MAGVVVWVLVATAITLAAHQLRGCVAQVQWNGQGAVLAHRIGGDTDRFQTGVALGRAGQVGGGLRQDQATFGQTDAIERLGRCIGQGQGMWIGVANVLGGKDQHAACDEARVLPTFEHAREPVDRGVGVTAAQALDEGRDHVVVGLAPFVVVGQACLDGGFDGRAVDCLLLALGRAVQQSQRTPRITLCEPDQQVARLVVDL